MVRDLRLESVSWNAVGLVMFMPRATSASIKDHWFSEARRWIIRWRQWERSVSISRRLNEGLDSISAIVCSCFLSCEWRDVRSVYGTTFHRQPCAKSVDLVTRIGFSV